MYDHLRSYPTTERMVVNDSVLIFLRSSSSPTTLSVMSYFYFYIYIYKQKENSKFKNQKESLLWVAGPVGVCLMGQSHLCSPHPAQHPSPSFSFFFFLNITKKTRTTPLETNATLPTPRSQSPQHLLTRQDTHKCDVYTGIYLQRYMGVL